MMEHMKEGEEIRKAMSASAERSIACVCVCVCVSVDTHTLAYLGVRLCVHSRLQDDREKRGERGAEKRRQERKKSGGI